MKKTKIGLLVLFVVAASYTAASWWVGMRTQTLMTQSVEQTNHQIAQAFGRSTPRPQASISDYQRGVFTSSLRYTMDLSGLADTPQSVQVQIDVHHGPFPWRLLTRGAFKPLMVYAEARVLPTPFVQPLLDLAGERALYAEARVDFSQNGSGEVTIAPIVVKKDGDELRFSGGQMHLTLTNGMADSAATGGFASLDVLEQGVERVRVRDIRITAQTHRDEAGTRSDSHMEAATVLLNMHGVGELQMDRFGIDFASAQKDALVDYDATYRVGAARIDERDFGALDLGFSGKRIHLPALMALVQVLEQVENGAPDLDALVQHTSTLLQAQPTISLEPLRWKTAKGESRAHLSAALFAPEQGVELDTLFDDTGFLNYVREVKLSIDVSRAMAIDVAAATAGEDNSIARGMFAMLFDQYAAQLQSAGVAQVQDDNVSVQATFRNEDESVEINGQRMPFMEFVILLGHLF